MAQHPIFWPMAALAFLTFVVVALVGLRRVAAARKGEVKGSDFLYGESPSVPGSVSVVNRNYMNLLELPVLFYVASLMYDVSARVDITALYLAWLYVGLRIGHTVIHLTYNHVLHRLAAFTASNFVLIMFWIRLCI